MLSFPAARAAVLVVDMQNDFCHPEGFYARNGQDIAGLAAAVEGARDLVARGRAAGARIVYTRIVRDPTRGPVETRHRLVPKRWFSYGERLVAGTWGAEIVDPLRPEPGEPVIDKSGYSAFRGSALETVLREAGTESLILCGVVSYACVLATAFDAFDRGFDVVLAADAAGSWFDHLGRGTEEIVDLLLGHAVPAAEIDLRAGA